MQIAVATEVLVDPLDPCPAAGDGAAAGSLGHQEHGLKAAALLAAAVQSLMVARAEVASQATPKPVPADAEVLAHSAPSQIGEGERVEKSTPLGDAA